LSTARGVRARIYFVHARRAQEVRAGPRAKSPVLGITVETTGGKLVLRDGRDVYTI
jgi:hypothetical protein